MPYNEEISDTSLLVSALSMLAARVNSPEPEDADKVLDKILEDAKKVEQYRQHKEAVEPTHDDTLLFVVVNKGEKEPKEYVETFKKYDFRSSKYGGGYWANIPFSKLMELFHEYRGIDEELNFKIQLSKRGEK